MMKNNVLPGNPCSYLDTTDEVLDYSQNGFDRHSDSIISTKAAYQLEIRKTSSHPISLKAKKSDLQAFQASTKQKLENLLQSFKDSLQTLPKPDLLKSPSEEQSLKIEQLRLKLKKDQDDRLARMKKQYDEKKATMIDEKRDSLQKFWRGKVFALNNKLQNTEWTRNSKQVEDEERVKSMYEKAYQDALKSESAKLEEEIEEHFSKQFQEKVAEMSPQSSYRDEDELKNAVESEISVRRMQERVKWDSEKKKIYEKLDKQAADEQDLLLEKKEEEIRQKYRKINAKMLDEEQLRSQQILQQLQKIHVNEKQSENLQQYLEDWSSEARSEVVNELALEYKQEITPAITKDLKKILSHLIGTKLQKSDQEKVFHEAGEELNLSFELFKKEAETFFKNQVKFFEDSLKETLDEKIKEKAAEKIETVEKEVYIKFLKKLEKLKQDLKKTFEGKDLEEMKVRNIQKIKENWIKEKQVLAQYKAKNNIEISRLDDEIKTNSLKLEEEVLRLEAKTKEAQLKKREFRTRKEKMISKTPSRPLNGCISALSPDIHKETPTDLVPTCSSAKGVHINYEFSTKMNSPYRGNSPRNLHTQFMQQLLLKDSASVKSLSYDNFRFPSREVLNTTKLKQSMYHELLKEKFGYIEPRLK